VGAKLDLYPDLFRVTKLLIIVNNEYTVNLWSQQIYFFLYKPTEYITGRIENDTDNSWCE